MTTETVYDCLTRLTKTRELTPEETADLATIQAEGDRVTTESTALAGKIARILAYLTDAKITDLESAIQYVKGVKAPR